MRQSVACTVNNKALLLDVEIGESLLEALRRAGLTGAKQGCGVGECGACTVLVDNVAVNSCLYLAVRAEGKHIRTVEGECATGLSHFQQALVDEGAVQCGFCTPGIVMAGTALLEDIEKNGKTISREEIRHAMAGNLCRCTGYDTIINAVERCLPAQQKDS